MTPNPGHMPAHAAGRRVIVRLRNGSVCAPPGWPADGRWGCRWSLTGAPHDIIAYRVI